MTTPTATDRPTSTDAAAPGTLMYGDLTNELAITRRVLERVPDGRTEWRPHERSMTLGQLATHVAAVPGYTLMLLDKEEVDLAKGSLSAPTLPTTAEILALFDQNAAAMQAAVAAADAAALGRTWTLRHGDHVILSQRKGALIRTMAINHLIHHRAQLTVYLRLLDVPVPWVYGPSADEAMS
jgi:uncharacterized damage-inducible protein DinB